VLTIELYHHVDPLKNVGFARFIQKADGTKYDVIPGGRGGIVRRIHRTRHEPQISIAGALLLAWHPSPSPRSERSSQPIPRTSDGKPDMNGVFSTTAAAGRRESIAFQPWAKEKHDAYVARKLADNPTARCLSPGLISLTTVNFFPIQFVQTPGQMVILYEWDHFFRVIPTDGRKQTDDPDPLQSLGHSVGRWDGDTLVVDVVGFSDYTWIDNNAGVHSDALHVVERFRMIDKDTIEYRRCSRTRKPGPSPGTSSRR
jgi:hypothetical protein